MRALTMIAVLMLGIMGMAYSEDEAEKEGVKDHNGYRLTAPADYPPRQNGDDPGPVQTFEIVRPGDVGILLSRLLTSCECIQLEADKAYFGDGERAFVRLRNVKPTSKRTYPFYVQLSSPEKMTLRYDAEVESYDPPADDEKEEKEEEKKAEVSAVAE